MGNSLKFGLKEEASMINYGKLIEIWSEGRSIHDKLWETHEDLQLVCHLKK
jgi:hypothetical protein